MPKTILQTILIFSILVIFFLGSSVIPSTSSAYAQQPTVSILTVTGTPLGPTITVNADNDQINVRSGPGTEYNKLGVLISGQVISAIGKSVAGLWILIEYPGVEGGLAWVYAPLVTVSGGTSLPIVAPPPTPSPAVTATIDPTLAAQFVLNIPATRLPTFTAPPPLAIPTFTNDSPESSFAFLPPMGIFITLFGVIGIMGTLVSFARRR